jgi:Flp pilus assembly protein TadG
VTPAQTLARRADRGSVAVEVVLVAPLLVGLLVLVAGLGRIAHTREQLDGAAADAARTASLQWQPLAAVQAGQDAARAYLGADACRRLDVAVDTSQFRSGGQVTATVHCTASLGGLGLAGFPGSHTFTASSTVPLGIHRSRG